MVHIFVALAQQRETCSSESGSGSNSNLLIRERVNAQRQFAHQGADQRQRRSAHQRVGQKRLLAGASRASKSLPSLWQTVILSLRQTVISTLRWTVSPSLQQSLLTFAANSCPDGISAISDKPPQLGQKLIKGVRFSLSSRSRRPPFGHGRMSGSPSRDRSLLCGRQLEFTQRLGAGCLSCGEADSLVDLDQRRRLKSGHHTVCRNWGQNCLPQLGQLDRPIRLLRGLLLTRSLMSRSPFDE